MPQSLCFLPTTRAAVCAGDWGRCECEWGKPGKPYHQHLQNLTLLHLWGLTQDRSKWVTGAAGRGPLCPFRCSLVLRMVVLRHTGLWSPSTVAGTVCCNRRDTGCVARLCRITLVGWLVVCIRMWCRASVGSARIAAGMHVIQSVLQ